MPKEIFEDNKEEERAEKLRVLYRGNFPFDIALLKYFVNDVVGVVKNES